MAYIYEVVELEQNHKMVMRTADGPFPMETTYIFEAVDENITHMKLRNRGKPSGFSKIMSPFMAKMMHKANNKDLQKLKELLEN